MKQTILIILIGFLSLVILSASAQLNTTGAIKGAIQHPALQDTSYYSGKSEPSRTINSNSRFLKSLEDLKSRTRASRPFQNSLATSEIVINFSSNLDLRQICGKWR